MTTLREAAQQALETLEALQGGCTDSDDGTVEAITVWCPEVIDALSAALAEPVQEPVAWSHINGTSDTKWRPAEPVEEPVAKVELMTTGGNAGLATRIVEIDDHLRERLRPGQLLYTAPPQRKPLTEEEIREIFFAELRALPSYPSAIEELPERLARAIERAHGVTP